MEFKALSCQSKKILVSESFKISFNKSSTQKIMKDKPNVCTICKRVRQELLNQRRLSELSQFEVFMKTYNMPEWRISVW